MGMLPNFEEMPIKAQCLQAPVCGHTFTVLAKQKKLGAHRTQHMQEKDTNVAFQ